MFLAFILKLSCYLFSIKIIIPIFQIVKIILKYIWKISEQK